MQQLNDVPTRAQVIEAAKDPASLAAMGDAVVDFVIDNYRYEEQLG